MTVEVLVLVAHGSRRPAANDEVAALAERLARLAAGRFDRVRHAFLEAAAPSVAEAVDACVTAGADRVTLLPYFLAAGRHVTADLPALVAAARSRHPGVELRLLPHLGGTDVLPALLLEVALGEA